MSDFCERLEELFQLNLKPSHLSVIDESSNHGNGNATETHIRVRIVCSQWENYSLVQRHKEIYALLHSHMQGELHAVAIEALSTREFKSQGEKWLGKSPDCANK